MSDCPQEREARYLLAQAGATFIRMSGNGHEVWKLPNGKNFVCNKASHSAGVRAWRNNLTTLKRLLRPEVTNTEKTQHIRLVPPPNPPAIIPTALPASPPKDTPYVFMDFTFHDRELTPKEIVELATQPTGEIEMRKSKDGDWTPEQDALLMEADADPKCKLADMVELVRSGGRPHATEASVMQRRRRLQKKAEKARKGRGLAALLPSAPPLPTAPPPTVQEDMVDVVFQSTRGTLKFKVDGETAKKMAALALNAI